MASVEKLTEMMGFMKTIYPYYANGVTLASLVKTWNMMIGNYPDELVQVAFKKAFETCTQPPTPAHIISIIKAIEKTNDLSDEALWESLNDTLRDVRRQVYRFQFTAIESNGKTQGQNARLKVEKIWNELHPKLKQFIASENGLIRLSDLDDEALKFEKNRFLKSMPLIEKRMELKEEIEHNPQVMRLVQGSFRMIGD